MKGKCGNTPSILVFTTIFVKQPESFQISLCIAKHGKPLSDRDFIEMAILYVSKSLFHEFPNKVKIMQHVSEMPLSRNPVKDARPAHGE